MLDGGIGRIVRFGVVIALTAAFAAVAQPAFALSSSPDSTWGTNGKEYALAQFGNTLFVGGAFTKAVSPSGQKVTASNVAAFNITTGAFIPTFSAAVTNTLTTVKPEVDALAVSTDGATLYIGGSFDTVNGSPRQNLAAVDTATGTQLNPAVDEQPDQRIQAIVAGPSLVYLGGNFTEIDGLPRIQLAALSAADGTLSNAWTPSATAGTDPCPSQFPTGTSCGPVSNGGTGNVHSLALSPDGTGVFVGGNFYYMNGTPRNALAEVSASDGSLMSWKVPWATIPSEGPGNPYTGPNVVWAILPTAARIYIGYGRTPNGFEAFDPTTTVTSGECASGCAIRRWAQGTPGNAESLALSPDGTRLFVGGHFGTGVLDYQPSGCGGAYAHGLISVNPATGAYFCDWIPQMIPFGGQNAPGSHINPPNYVGGFAMQMTSNALFVGGFFTSISGVTQSGVARFTLSGTPPPPPPVPSITSFSPTSGVVGTTVTITGSSFTGTTSVSFNATQATTFSVDSDTQITTVVPNGATNGRITVTNPGGTGKSASSFKVIVPAITALTPDTGPVGTTVTISGAGFSGATDVQFNGVQATFTVVKDSKITATVPVGATTGFVTVATPNGVLQSGVMFTVT
jgi:hypothetical protein